MFYWYHQVLLVMVVRRLLVDHHLTVGFVGRGGGRQMVGTDVLLVLMLWLEELLVMEMMGNFRVVFDLLLESQWGLVWWWKVLQTVNSVAVVWVLFGVGKAMDVVEMGLHVQEGQIV